jgi:deoxycytidylate deaminase
MAKPYAQTTDERMMRRCFALAKKSAEQGEYPYAAVIARNGKIVAETTNKVAHDHDVTHHAEVVAICQAQKTLGSIDLADCTIYAKWSRVLFAATQSARAGLPKWSIPRARLSWAARPAGTY